MSENKTVIEHLEDIKKALEPKKAPRFKPYKEPTISDLIGEPFDPYFDSSTIYCYEPDERRFRNYKTEKCRKIFLMFLISLIPLIAHILLSILFNQILYWCLIGDIILLLPSIFCFIYGVNQKNKKLANSKWNMENHNFYKYKDKLSLETKKGTIAYLLTCLKIFCICIFIVLLLIPLFQTYEESLMVTFLVTDGLLLGFLPIPALIHFNDYEYSSFIFDNAETYLLFEQNTWKKFKK